MRGNFGFGYLVVVLGEGYRRIFAFRLCCEYRFSFFVILAHDHRDAFLYYPGFFSRYFCEGISKELRVVKTDVGDDREDGRDDIGAVEPSAQSHFYNGVIRLLLGKVLECECSGQFKETGMERLEKLSFLSHEIHHALFAYTFAVHPYPLPEVYKVRRGVQSHFIAFGLQHRCY